MPRRFALVIAAQQYQYPERFRRLKKSLADARAVAALLAQSDIFDIPADNITLLDDKPWSETLPAVEKFFRNPDLRRDDLLLLYFAGHGERVAQSGQDQLCLILRDSDPEAIGSTSIDCDRLRQWMDYSRSKHQVVILDCCYSGAFEGRSSDMLPDKLLATRGAVGGSSEGEARFVLAATDKTTIASEREEGNPDSPNALYTGCLLEALRSGAAANPSGAVTVQGLHRYLRDAVREKSNGRQTPRIIPYAGSDLTLAASPHRPLPADVIALAKDANPDMRLAAVQRILFALQDMPSRERDARLWLAKLAVDRDGMVKPVAAEALAKLDANVAPPPEPAPEPAPAPAPAPAPEPTPEPAVGWASARQPKPQTGDASSDGQRRAEARPTKKEASPPPSPPPRPGIGQYLGWGVAAFVLLITGVAWLGGFDTKVSPNSPDKPAVTEPVEQATPQLVGNNCWAGSPGATCRDSLKVGGQGPEMLLIPAGRFRMGDIQGGGDDDEKPVHGVAIPRAFALGRHEVTFDDYDRFARATGHKLPGDEGWGRGRRPVINVSWKDAVAYVEWLSEQTGKRYRLPTEAEWEYAARAGSESKYGWGNEIGSKRANCEGCGSRWDNKQTAPVGSFSANAFGLHDTAGNVWEWVQDKWHDDYSGAPVDGSAWEGGDGSAARRVLRGGAWLGKPGVLRSAFRDRSAPDVANYFVGFRLARTL